MAVFVVALFSRCWHSACRFCFEPTTIETRMTAFAAVAQIKISYGKELIV